MYKDHWKKNYNSYLCSKHWKKRRKEIIEQHWDYCSNCFSRHDIQVHHLTYENVWEEKCEDCKVICRNCHAKEHWRFFSRKIDYFSMQEIADVMNWKVVLPNASYEDLIQCFYLEPYKEQSRVLNDIEDWPDKEKIMKDMKLWKYRETI